MNIKSHISLLIFTLILLSTSAQKQDSTFSKNKFNASLPKYQYWCNKGFDFQIGAGVYFANKYTAQYYNGKSSNENNLDFLLLQKYRYDTLVQFVQQNIGYTIGDSLWINADDYPQNMSYKISYYINLGLSYHFSKNWSLSLRFSNTKLTAQDIFLLNFETQSGNEFNHYLKGTLQGKEIRNMFSINVKYTFHPHKNFKPFIGLGFQVLNLKIKSFNAYILNRDFNLLNTGQNYTPGTQQQISYTEYGGTGFGFVGDIGLKIAFNKFISIDPSLSINWIKLPLTNYPNFKFNYAVYIAFVFNDLIFSAKKNK